MNDLIEKVKHGLRCCKNSYPKDCKHCPYQMDCTHHETCDILIRNALSLIEQMAQEIDDLRAGIPSAEEEPEARTPENLLDMSENARIERVIDKLRLMRRQFQPGSQKSGAILDAMFFLRLMQNRSIEAGDKE